MSSLTIGGGKRTSRRRTPTDDSSNVSSISKGRRREPKSSTSDASKPKDTREDDASHGPFLLQYDASPALQSLCTQNGISRRDFPSERLTITRLEMFLGSWEGMSCVQHFVNLVSLTIVQQVQVETLFGIGHCPNLEELWVSECSLVSLDVPGARLSQCRKLKKLVVNSNALTCLTGRPFEHCTALEHLDLSDNGISNLEGLGDCTGLTKLSLCRNRLRSIGSALEPLVCLTSLSLADNELGCLKDLLHLNRLPALVHLSLSDPHYGDNPVCRLYNYQTYALCQLPQLRTLDAMTLTPEMKSSARGTFLKKKMYYNMRIKTFQRNVTSIVTLVTKYCQDVLLQDIDVHMDALFQIQAALEFGIQSFEHYQISPQVLHPMDDPSSEPRRNNHDNQEDPALDAKLNKFRKDRASVQTCLRLKTEASNQVRQTLAAFEQDVRSLSNIAMDRLYLELNTGGNVKLEEGKVSDIWYTSCCELLRSRFFAHEFQPLGISDLRIQHVTRIHNRFLRRRFEHKMEQVLQAKTELFPGKSSVTKTGISTETTSAPVSESSSSSSSSSSSGAQALEYLFCIETPEQELLSMAELGSDERPAVTLSNSLAISDLPHIAWSQHQQGCVAQNRNPSGTARDWQHFGWNNTKTTLDASSSRKFGQMTLESKDWSLRPNRIIIAKVFLGPVQDLSEAVEERAHVNEYLSRQQEIKENPALTFVQSKPDDATQKIFHSLDAAFVLPEYIVDYEYVVSSSRSSLVSQDSEPHANPVLLSSLIEQIKTKLVDPALSEFDVGISTQACLDLEILARRLEQFITRCEHIEHQYHHEAQDPRELLQTIATYIPNRQLSSEITTRMTMPLLEQLTNSSRINLAEIQYLNLSRQGLCSIEHLSECPNLEHLVLSFNHLLTLRGLEDCLKIHTLDCSVNSITQLDRCTHLSKLTHLNLRSNNLECVQDLSVFDVLEHLDLRQNPICLTKDYTVYVLDLVSGLITLDGTPVSGYRDATTPQLDTKSRKHHRSITALSVASILRQARGGSAIDIPETALDDEEEQEQNLENLKDILDIDFHHERLKTLENLQALPNLKRANFADNEISDMGNVRFCPALEELNLEDNHIRHIQGCSSLHSLVKLELGKNSLTSLDDMHGLTNLTQLSIENNDITSLSGISSLVKLAELYAGNNKFQDLNTTIRSLKSLPKLIILDLTGNPVCRDRTYRLYSIYYLRRLRVLDSHNITLDEQKQAKFRFSGRLTTEFILEKIGSRFHHVEELELSCCRIRAIESLDGAKFTNLTNLNLVHNDIRSIDGFDQLSKLQILRLSHNKIESLVPARFDLRDTRNDPECTELTNGDAPDSSSQNTRSGLRACPNVQILYLDHNRISDLAGLDLIQLPHLTYLNLSNNHLTQITGLRSNPALQALNLSKNKLTQIDSNDFSALLQLKKLSLSENEFKSLDGFDSLQTLEHLYLGQNRLTNLAEVEKLSRLELLKELTLRHNPMTKKQLYRQTILHRLPGLLVLDERDVSMEERERIAVIFPSDPPPLQDELLSSVYVPPIHPYLHQSQQQSQHHQQPPQPSNIDPMLYRSSSQYRGTTFQEPLARKPMITSSRSTGESRSGSSISSANVRRSSDINNNLSGGGRRIVGQYGGVATPASTYQRRSYRYSNTFQ